MSRLSRSDQNIQQVLRYTLRRRNSTTSWGQTFNHPQQGGLMGFFSSLFSAPSKKDQMIEWAIETLGREGSIVGTAYKEISYDDVVSYMQKPSCRSIKSIKDAHNGWIDFEASVKSQKYEVTLSRTFEGHGSVLTSKKA